jgi:hypothetical protein
MDVFIVFVREECLASPPYKGICGAVLHETAKFSRNASL